MVIAIAAVKARRLIGLDVGNAYLEANMKGEEIIVELDAWIARVLIKLRPEFKCFVDEHENISRSSTKPFMDAFNQRNCGTTNSGQFSKVWALVLIGMILAYLTRHVTDVKLRFVIMWMAYCVLVQKNQCSIGWYHSCREHSRSSPYMMRMSSTLCHWRLLRSPTQLRFEMAKDLNVGGSWPLKINQQFTSRSGLVPA